MNEFSLKLSNYDFMFCFLDSTLYLYLAVYFHCFEDISVLFQAAAKVSPFASIYGVWGAPECSGSPLSGGSVLSVCFILSLWTETQQMISVTHGLLETSPSGCFHVQPRLCLVSASRRYLPPHPSCVPAFTLSPQRGGASVFGFPPNAVFKWETSGFTCWSQAFGLLILDPILHQESHDGTQHLIK